jgi:recombination protein RecT
MTQTSSLRARAHGKEVAQQDDPAKRRELTTKNAVRQMEAQFQLAMPKGTEAAQLVRDAMTLFSATPRLALCDSTSVLGGLMTCAQLGLRPGVLGQAWLIPFKGKAQLVVGYQGLITLAQRSGDIASIFARCIHENDQWDVEYGTENRLVHKPFLRGPRGEVVGYYAVVKSTRGGTYWEFMTRADAEEHRDKFAMARKDKDGQVVGPWADHFDAMALKTVLIRSLKLAPRNTEIQQAFAVDNTVRVDVQPTAQPEDVSMATVAGEVAEDDWTAAEQPDEGDATLDQWQGGDQA